MKVSVINESGYEQSALGFSLSWNSSPERAKELFKEWAFKSNGENKFLESIVIWLDVTAPRFFWCEADTYRVGTTKQSESTMHTITKAELDQDNFEKPILPAMLNELNKAVDWYKEADTETKKRIFLMIKSNLPEGFLQRRIWMMSYKTLQGIYVQRIKHRLPQWQYFLNTVLSQIEHPEFIVKDYNGN